MQPETRYALSGGARIAYQRFGPPEPTLVFAGGSFSHTDVVWEDPAATLFFTRLASFVGVIRYDHLGTSNSDPFPVDGDPTWRGYAEELQAVLASSGVERVALLGVLDAGPMVLHFAAEHPELVSRLILFNTAARFVTGDGYPHGMTAERVEQLLALFQSSWGSDASEFARVNVPSQAGDARFVAWYAKFLRALGTPGTMTGALRRALTLDARAELARITQPTLIMHRADYQIVPFENAEYLAEHIPGAKLVELRGADGPAYWEHPDSVIDAIREFVEGGTQPTAQARELLTVLFTDIVRSTERLSEVGDRDWNATLRVHNDVAESLARLEFGRIVKHTGDGLVVTFGDPERAVAFARELRARLSPIGVTIRAGLHTGVVNVSASDIDGLTVHIAARVMGAAADGEIAASRTTRDLLLGSRFRFQGLGERTLKGVDGSWELFALTS